jgi:hypothetical protein
VQLGNQNQNAVSSCHAFEILRIKNRFQPLEGTETTRVMGYRDVSIKLRFGHKESDSGCINFVPVQEWSSSSGTVRTMVAEIQLRLKDFQNVLEKKSCIHENYAVYRDILSS